MGKFLKAGAVVLSAVGGAAGIYSTVNQIVEQYNYNNIHEINISYTYLINGEEVDKEAFDAMLGNMDAVVDVQTRDCTVIGEEAVTIYYGAAVDFADLNLAALTAVSYDHMYANFTCHIDAGDPVTDAGEYPMIVFPAKYEVTKFETAGFALAFDSYVIRDLEVCYLADASYDEDIGGIDYTIYFK